MHLKAPSPAPSLCQRPFITSKLKPSVYRTCAHSHERHVTPPLYGAPGETHVQEEGFTRRGLIHGVGLASVAWLLTPLQAARAARYDYYKPCVMTVRNSTSHLAEAFWMSPTGGAELFQQIPPGGSWTIDTFVMQSWCFVDAITGAVLQEYVAQPGPQVVQLLADGVATVSAVEEDAVQPDPDSYDGLGHSADAYASAKVTQVMVNSEGALVLVEVDGFDTPLGLLVGPSEATALVFAAAGSPQSRPSMIDAWYNSIQAANTKVKRVVISHMEEDTFYARVILQLPSGSQASIDTRPVDALGLALAAEADMFVCKRVAETVQNAAARHHFEDLEEEIISRPA